MHDGPNRVIAPPVLDAGDEDQNAPDDTGKIDAYRATSMNDACPAGEQIRNCQPQDEREQDHQVIERRHLYRIGHVRRKTCSAGSYGPARFVRKADVPVMFIELRERAPEHIHTIACSTQAKE